MFNNALKVKWRAKKVKKSKNKPFIYHRKVLSLGIK